MHTAEQKVEKVLFLLTCSLSVLFVVDKISTDVQFLQSVHSSWASCVCCVHQVWSRFQM